MFSIFSFISFDHFDIPTENIAYFSHRHRDGADALIILGIFFIFTFEQIRKSAIDVSVIKNALVSFIHTDFFDFHKNNNENDGTLLFSMFCAE